jgi:outer membrane protein assembly factor BamB
MNSDYLHIGCNGIVAAIDPQNGQEIWRTSLNTGFFNPTSHQDVNVVEHNGIVIAGCNGYLYGLDANSGSILWSNELTGMGHNDITMCIGGKTIQTIGKPKDDD